jgi:hypothetical protein
VEREVIRYVPIELPVEIFTEVIVEKIVREVVEVPVEISIETVQVLKEKEYIIVEIPTEIHTTHQ